MQFHFMPQYDPPLHNTFRGYRVGVCPRTHGTKSFVDLPFFPTTPFAKVCRYIFTDLDVNVLRPQFRSAEQNAEFNTCETFALVPFRCIRSLEAVLLLLPTADAKRHCTNSPPKLSRSIVNSTRPPIKHDHVLTSHKPATRKLRTQYAVCCIF